MMITTENKLYALFRKYTSEKRIRKGYRLVKRINVIRWYFDKNGNLTGIYFKVPSESRDKVIHYTMIGKYGMKCTCEDAIFRRTICSHMIAGFILYFVVKRISLHEEIIFNEIKEIIEKFQKNNAF